MKGLLFFVWLCTLLSAGYRSVAQTTFIPDPANEPTWYVLSGDGVICLMEGCYYSNRVHKYTIQAHPARDSVYILYREIVSANYNFLPGLVDTLGELTVMPSGQVRFLENDDAAFASSVGPYTYSSPAGMLVYDPDIEVGDTFDHQFSWSYGSSFITSGNRYLVETIDTVLLAGAMRKRWKLIFPPGAYFEWDTIALPTNLAPTSLLPIDTILYWYEGIGSSFAPFPNEFWEGVTYRLQCYVEHGDTIYRKYPGYSCDMGLVRPSSVGDPLGLETVKVYPNPAQNKLFVKTDVSQNGSFRLFDLSGRLILHADLIEDVIDVSAVQPGMYIYSVEITGKPAHFGKVLLE